MAGTPFRLVLAGAALLAAAPDTVARTYKWVDAEGTTHYSQSPPPGGVAGVVTLGDVVTGESEANADCASLACRAGRLEADRRAREAEERKLREAEARAARKPVYPTPVKETDDEKIARLVAECKASRGSRCESDDEKRRMLLKEVELTQWERRALRGLTPAQQRRVLLQRIPERFRDLE